MRQKNIATFIVRCLLRLSTSKQIDGMWIGALGFGQSEIILRRVEEALALIRTFDPVRYNRIVSDLDRVWVRPVPIYLGHFNASLNACEIDIDFVLDKASSPEQIAAIIVHEATHARLDSFGYEEKLRPRIEAVCLGREIAFAAKLPNGAHVRESAESTLAACGTENYWSNAAFENRDVQAARDLGIPDWFIRTLVSIREFKSRVKRVIQRA